MRAWLILAMHSIADWFEEMTDDRHLTTDPACVEHRPPSAGSWLDRASRGVGCVPCQVTRAYGHTLYASQTR